MLTRTKTRTSSGLAVGLLLGALACNASATEEVVVYGGEAAAAAKAQEAMLESQIKDRLRLLNEQLKDELSKGLKERPRADVKLALAGEAPRRG